MTQNCDNSLRCTRRFIFVLLLVTQSDSAKILAIMPTSSFSHQTVFRPLWRELSLRGHQVSLLTTHPTRDASLTNLTEIHLESVNAFFEEVKFYENFAEQSENFIEFVHFLKSVTMQLTHRLLESPPVQDLLKSGDRFDLVVAEALFPSSLGLVGYYKCPWIGVSSLEPALHFHLAIGNPVHPVLNPDTNLDVGGPEDLNFKERVFSFVYRNAYMHEYKGDLLPRLTGISRRILGEDLPSLIEVQNNISMLFSNTHPIFHNVRPVYPNTIFVGSGMHLNKPEPLSNSARILGIIPTGSHSHQAPFKPLWRELAARGHQVTVMTTDPQNNPALPKLKEIDLSFTYDHYQKYHASFLITDYTMYNFWKANYLSAIFKEVQEAQLSHPEVQQLIRNRDVKFDLVMVEAILPGMLAFGWRFQCPIIAVASTDSSIQYHESMGNFVHPIASPDKNLDLEDIAMMSFTQRLISFWYTIHYKLLDHYTILPGQHKLMKKYFGSDLPDLLEIRNNISMMFIGTHPLFQNVRPINPNTITLFGTHLKNPEGLPQSARILGIIPIASYSHQTPFQPLWRELAARGHQVTVMTTDPENNSTLTNLKEIDLSFTYDIYRKHNASSIVSDETKSYFEIAAVLAAAFKEAQEAQLSHPEVQELILNGEFDLVMVEGNLPGMLAFGWRFQCPIIAVASMDCSMQYHDSMGNLVHPILNPDNNLGIEDVATMSFRDRLASFVFIALYKLYIYNKTFKRNHETLTKYFGDDLPDLLHIQNNISMVFVGTHPIFHNIRPINPNTITIIGTHIKDSQELPHNIQTFLDGAQYGAIYFSLGSNVNAGILNDDFKKILLDTFASLPYRVLLKLDADLTDVPKNVLVQKWMPQQDIFRHPRLRLFITQGGLQSLQEAVTYDVPIVGIPFFGDQLSNINKVVNRGYGLKIDRKRITKESLANAIKEVIENPKYQEKAKEMGAIFRDEEMPSLQRAVYWTEYVIRHKGAPHLRSPAVGMPAWKYYMLDILGFLILVVVAIVLLCYLFVKITFMLIARFSSAKKLKRKTK